MKRVLRLLFIFILVLTVAACSDDEGQLGADASPDAVPDLAGTYVVNGIDHLNNEYGGHLTIHAGANPNEYELQWILNESVQTGTGVLQGNQLIASWKSMDTSTTPYQGQVTYTVTEDGQLYGTRTVDGRAGEGTEKAYPNQ